MTTNVTPAILAQSVQLTTATVAYVTGGVNAQTIIKQAAFSNVTAGAVVFSVWHVPSGGSFGVTNVLILNRSIAAAPGTDLAPELINLVLAPGDTIQCSAGANASINFTASGFIAT